MLKAITGVKFVSSTKTKAKKDRDGYEYSLNKDIIEYHSKLLKFRDPDTVEYHKDAITLLNLVLKDVKYWFGK